MIPALSDLQVPTQTIDLLHTSIGLDVRREDLLHPYISGNKYRKLKYNLAFLSDRQAGAPARRTGGKANAHQVLLTYGGAFSNHIAATAAAGKEADIKTIGIIRGEELGEDLQKTLKNNKTLSFAVSQGMHLEFISRSSYRIKDTENFRESVLRKFEPFYELPEGGTNALAVKGCMEIVTEADRKYDYICCPAGTGGTAAGIIEASGPHQKVLVFSALRGDFLKTEIEKYTSKTNWQLLTDYHFGGYAKVNEVLIKSINDFKRNHGIPLDPIYTGKMMYGIMLMVKNGFFPQNTRILAIHTGGLQGIAGINDRLRAKNAPELIDVDD